MSFQAPKQSAIEKPTIIENTYKMKPDDGQAFQKNMIKTTIQNTLDELFTSEKYSPSQFSFLAKIVSDQVKDKVKVMGMTRYKLVCHVMVTSNDRQGLIAGSRCLWDNQSDNFCFVSYKTSTCHVVVSLFAAFFE